MLVSTHPSRPQRDVMLYNLGIGATEKELQWTYEGSDEFAPLPTFGVIPQFPASAGLPLDWLPNFNPASITFFRVTPMSAWCTNATRLL